ncbi:MAG: hypothetical protein K6B13_01030 [Prevotella sp.]|nr:hypothetical protein [Prevotella sp.]
MFAKQGQHIIHLIHPQCLLTLFEVSYKPEAHAVTLIFIVASVIMAVGCWIAAK